MAARRARVLLPAVLLVLLVVALLLWRALSAAPGGQRAPAVAESPPAPRASEAPPAARPPPLPAPSVAPDAAPAWPPVPPPVVPASFEGQVVTAGTGLPVPGADLTFSRAGAAATVRTLPDGSFRFEPPAPGRWRLAAASAPGHFPFAPEWGHSPVEIEARPGERLRGIVVVLERAAAYRVTVVDREDRPIAGAEVRLLGARTGASALLPLEERFTADDRGEAAVVAPDGAVLEARHPSYRPARQRIGFAEQVTRQVKLRLRAGGAGQAVARGSIAGRVEGAAGGAVEGALVTATRRWRRWDGAATPSAQELTDGEGRFELTGLEDGSYRVVARHEGLAPAVDDAVETGTRDVALRLAGGGAVRGVVRSRATGEPVAPFSLVISARRGIGREPLHGMSVLDPSGRFELDGLPPGPASILVSAPGHAPAERELVVPAPGAPPEVVEVELGAGGRIEGTVLSRAEGRPLEGAKVAVEAPSSEAAPSPFPIHGESLTDAAGRFELGGLGPAPVSLFVSAPGHHARILSGLAPPEGGTLPRVEVELSPLGEGEEPRVELGGIGAVLALDGDRLRVVRVLAGGGAADVGLAAGDRIVRVEGQPVAQLGYAAAVELIRGPEGSAVTLEVVRGSGGPVAVSVPRKLVRG